MTEITTEYIEGIAELMEDADYSRFSWGHEVTQDVIRAAAVMVHREADGNPDMDDSMGAEAEVLRVMARGWTEYSDLGELASNDEEADELNTLMTRFGFPGAQREEADEKAALVLLKEARERGEGVVWFGDKDLPATSLVSDIIIFNKRTG